MSDLGYIEGYDIVTRQPVRIPLGDAEPVPSPKVGVAIRPERVRVSTSLIKDKRDGRIYLDPFKRFAKPYWLTTEPRTISLLVASGNFRTAPVVMPIDRQGPVEIDYSYFQSTGDFAITIFDPQNRPMLMNREIHIRTIASGFNTLGLGAPAGRPFIWPEPWFLNTGEGQRNFQVGFLNLTTLDNNIRFSLHGRRFYYQSSPQSVVDRYQKYYKGRALTSPFFYTTDQEVRIPAGTPAGTVLDFFIRIRDEADALFYKFTSVQNHPYELKLVEQSSQKELMSDFVRVENAMGDGELPFLLFEPMYFEAGYKLSFRVRTLTVEEDDLVIWPTFTCSRIARTRKEGA
ncbi:MAG: hypothetical protein ACREI9_04170 [Nitrospiraceae bacterium]